MKLTRAGDSREIDAEVISRDGSTVRVRIGDRQLAAEFAPNADGGGVLTIDGRRYPVFGARRKDSILVSVGPASFEFKPAEAASRRRARGLAAAEIIAPMPGKVIRLLVKAGDAVEAGQGLMVVEAMKMQNEIRSPKSGKVERLLAKEGQNVNAGDVLAWVE